MKRFATSAKREPPGRQLRGRSLREQRKGVAAPSDGESPGEALETLVLPRIGSIRHFRGNGFGAPLAKRLRALHLFRGFVHLSLLTIFAAGVLTFASPCVLPLIPVYLGVLGGAAIDGPTRRPVLAAAAFALGLSSVFVALGAAATALGTVLVAHRALLLLASGALMLLFGLRSLGVLRVRLFDREARPGLARVRDVAGIGGAFLFGAAFALGWSPCIGPVLASVLGYAATHATSPWRGAGLLAVYAAGLSAPLLVVAAFAPVALGWLRRTRDLIPRLEKLSGALMVVVGGWTMWSAKPEPSIAATQTETARVESVTVAPRVAASAECASTGHVCALPGGPATSMSAAAALEEGRGARMLEFVSAHCPVCQRMAPIIAEAERVCDGFGARIVRVDVSTSKGRALAERRRVLGTPTFVFVDRDDVESVRLVGEQPIEDVREAIERSFPLHCAVVAPRPSSSG